MNVEGVPLESGNAHPLFVWIQRPSVLWRCWLRGRKGIRPVKTEWWGAGMVICLERDADLHMAQLMPLPLTVCCFSRIQMGFSFLVPAHLGSPRQRAIKRVCVYVCYLCELLLCLLSINWLVFGYLLPWPSVVQGLQYTVAKVFQPLENFCL